MLVQLTKAKRPALQIDLAHGARFELEKFHQLRGGAAQIFRSRLQIPATLAGNVQRLGQQGRKVIMAGIDLNPSTTTACAPQCRHSCPRRPIRPIRQSKIHP